MKRISLFLLLLIHLNFSVFIPQFEESDRKCRNGVAVDDINSLSEFVYEIVLDNKDTTPEDEDNDHARDFHLLKIGTYFCQNIISITCVDLDQFMITTEHITDEEKTTSIVFDIPSPPPKA